MPLPPTGDTGEGPDDDPLDDDLDDAAEFRPPLPPEDRIWRHPSEVAAATATPAAPPSARRRVPAMAVVAVGSGLAGAALAAGAIAGLGGFDDGTRVVERQVAVQPVPTGAGDDGLAAIAERTSPSVAGVYVVRGDDQASGSAVVIRSDGHLLTNAHLVDDADEIDVRLPGDAVRPGRVVGIDRDTDLAVLHVDADGLEPAPIGSATGLRVGDEVVPMGHAHESEATGPIDRAVVAALDQRLRTQGDDVLHGMIVLDVALPPESGGGPLLDAGGAVVGITSVVPVTAEDDSSRTVATPSDVALHAADHLIEFGRVKHVWLGIKGVDLPPEEAADMAIGGGASVQQVIEESPADEAGLVAGDVIVAIEGRQVASMSEVIAALRTKEPGQQVDLTVRRDHDVVETAVTLAER